MIIRSPNWYGTREIRSTLQKIWNDLSQKPKVGLFSVQNSDKRLQASVDKAGRHFEHVI